MSAIKSRRYFELTPEEVKEVRALVEELDGDRQRAARQLNVTDNCVNLCMGHNYVDQR